MMKMWALVSQKEKGSMYGKIWNYFIMKYIWDKVCNWCKSSYHCGSLSLYACIVWISRQPRRYTTSESSEDGCREPRNSKSARISSSSGSDDDEGFRGKKPTSKPVPPKISTPSLTARRLAFPQESPTTSSLVEPQSPSPNQSVIGKNVTVIYILYTISA